MKCCINKHTNISLKQFLSGENTFRKKLLRQRPRLSYFILNSVISDSTIPRCSILLQTRRSVSFLKDTEMPVGTTQETQKCELSQVTMRKFCVCLINTIQVPTLKKHWDSQSTGLKKIICSIGQDKECNKKAAS